MNDVVVFSQALNPMLATLSWLSVQGDLKVETLYIVSSDGLAYEATVAAYRRSLAYHAALLDAAMPMLKLESIRPEDFGEIVAQADGAEFLLVPEQQSAAEGEDDGEDELVIVISYELGLLIDACEAAGREIWEAGIEVLCAHRTQAGPWLSLENAYFELANFAKSLSAWSPADLPAAWQGREGRLYRCLQAMQLWREGLLVEAPDLHKMLIQRVHQNTRDWGAQLALLLYKRLDAQLDLSEVPDWLRPYLASLLQTWGRPLTILPPLTDFRVTVLLDVSERPELLSMAVDAVQGQSYPHWRLLLADAGTNPNIESDCRQLAAQDQRISYIRSAKAPDSLYELVDTELLFKYVDSLVWSETYLEACIAFLREQPWAAAVGSSFRILKQAPGHQQLQHGPFYPQARLADTKKELQRLSQICTLGPTCLTRTSLLAKAGCLELNDDRLKAYSQGDYFRLVYLMGRYEIAYLPEVLMELQHVEAQTSSEREDPNPELLALFALILADYQALFGEDSYPLSVAELFVYCRMLDIQQRLTRLLMTVDAKDFDAAIAQQSRVWERFVAVKAQARQLCTEAASPLYDRENPYCDVPKTLAPSAGLKEPELT